MKPRIFISSTYYDLKHVRERLERFIKNYNFEPVLFESANVTFEHGKPRDISCYNEVNLCHIMILLIGGRYGSIISGDDAEKKKDIYNNEYTSITRKEFETALKKRIPVFIFIDKNVYAEYLTYKKNQIELEKEGSKFAFAHVDDKNIFKFISSIESDITYAIKTFEKVDEIERYLSEQIAGLFYLYLEQLQKNQKEQEVLDAVSELKAISERTDTMLKALGKQTLDKDNYEQVIFEQNKKIINFFVEQFYDKVTFDKKIPWQEAEKAKREIFEICKRTIFDEKSIVYLREKINLSIPNKKMQEMREDFILALSLNSYHFNIKKFSYTIIDNYCQNIYPIITEIKELKLHFENQMKYTIYRLISNVPF